MSQVSVPSNGATYFNSKTINQSWRAPTEVLQQKNNSQALNNDFVIIAHCTVGLQSIHNLLTFSMNYQLGNPFPGARFPGSRVSLPFSIPEFPGIR